MKESQSSYFESSEFLELLNSYESMEHEGVPRYFDGIDISNLAEFYSSMDEDDKASAAISYGLQIHPNDTDILIAQGHLLLKQGKSHEARTLAESINETNCRELLFLKGSIELYDEDNVMAERYFCQSVEAGDEDFGLYADIIAAFIDYGQYDYAQNWLDKAMVLEPDYKDFAEQQADLYMATQNLTQAEEKYNQLLDEYPYEIYYWEQLVCIAYRLEEWTKALDYFEYIEAIDPMYDSMQMIKVECLIENEHYAQAERKLRTMLEKTPDSSEVMFLLGNTLSLQQRNEEAIPYLTKAIEIFPDDPQMYIQLAAAQHECGQYKKAAQSLTKAFNGGFACHPDNIRLLMLQLLQDDDIQTVCDMLIALFCIENLDMDEYGVFLSALTMCCWQSGRSEDFRKYFGLAFDANPEGTLRLFGITDLTLSKELATTILLKVSQDDAAQTTQNRL